MLVEHWLNIWEVVGSIPAGGHHDCFFFQVISSAVTPGNFRNCIVNLGPGRHLTGSFSLPYPAGTLDA